MEMITKTKEYDLEYNGKVFHITNEQVWSKDYPNLKRWETKINGIPRYTSHPNRWRTTMPSKKEMEKHLKLYDLNYVGYTAKDIDGRIIYMKEL